MLLTGTRSLKLSLEVLGRPLTTLANSEQEELRKVYRQRKTDWKRRQGGQSFLDHVVINVRGGTGGNGCVAFHREKFKPFGPPSGGNGGRGGDVYILPTPHLTTLSSIPKRIRGQSGANGQGTWRNGKNGAALVIKVPIGTVVRELTSDDAGRSKELLEGEEEGLEGLSVTERRVKMREKRWLHYPNSEEDNMRRDTFRQAEAALFRQERESWLARKQHILQPIHLDLDKLEDTPLSPDAPLGVRHQESLGHLVASGGLGGLGNPHFLSVDNRSPKFATRGQKGECVTLSLELKLLADVGLVGMPNAGKSTLLRALTGGRAKSKVASYAFTTLNPVVGVVTVVDDDNITECFRFTIADNPGLVSRASENVGLGHSFLRSIERSLALAYVVDLSGPAPWDELRILREELDKYKPGLSAKARIVIANKADLLRVHDPIAEEEAREKLRRLEEFVLREMAINKDIQLGQAGRAALDTVPISAKLGQNLQKVVSLLRVYVGHARYSLQGAS